jgi:hypothetical protein
VSTFIRLPSLVLRCELHAPNASILRVLPELEMSWSSSVLKGIVIVRSILAIRGRSSLAFSNVIVCLKHELKK